MVPALMPGQSLLYESQGQRNRCFSGAAYTSCSGQRLIWPDNRFGQDSWLYIAVNQLHRNPIFTGKPDTGKPYLIVRVDWVQKVNLGANNIEPFSKRVPLFTNIDRSIHLGKPTEGVPVEYCIQKKNRVTIGYIPTLIVRRSSLPKKRAISERRD